MPTTGADLLPAGADLPPRLTSQFGVASGPEGPVLPWRAYPLRARTSVGFGCPCCGQVFPSPRPQSAVMNYQALSTQSQCAAEVCV